MVRKVDRAGKTGHPGGEVKKGVYHFRWSNVWVDKQTQIPQLVTFDKMPGHYARIRCDIVGEDGQATKRSTSVTILYPDQMPMWLCNFGLDPDRITDWSDPAKALMAVERLAKEGTRDLHLYVNERGWIQSCTMPDGRYFARIRGFIRGTDGKPRILRSTGGEEDSLYGTYPVIRMIGHLRIVTGEWENLFPFFMVDYALEWDEETQEVILPTRRRAARNMETFCEAFGVNFLELPRPADPENAVPEIEAAMLKLNRIVTVTYENGFLDASGTVEAPKDFEVLLAGQEPQPRATGAVPAAAPAVEPLPVLAVAPPEREEKSPWIDVLYAVIALQGRKKLEKAMFTSPDPVTGEGGGKLTPSGVAFCKEAVLPICQQYDLPTDFLLMETEHVITILEGMGQVNEANMVRRKVIEDATEPPGGGTSFDG